MAVPGSVFFSEDSCGETEFLSPPTACIRGAAVMPGAGWTDTGEGSFPAVGADRLTAAAGLLLAESAFCPRFCGAGITAGAGALRDSDVSRAGSAAVCAAAA